MSDAGNMAFVLETLREHEIPRFTLQRSRLSICGIPAGGYQEIASFHGTRFRFTAVLYQHDTTHLVFFEHEINGQWTPGSIDMDDTSFIRAFCCQFLGFIYSAIVTEPKVLQIAFGVNLVVSLQPAGNSDRPPIRYNAPFTTCVRGLCHGIQPRFLPARADCPGVVVSHALLVVAIGARSRSTDTTHASDATTQTLHSAQTLDGSHP